MRFLSKSAFAVVLTVAALNSLAEPLQGDQQGDQDIEEVTVSAIRIAKPLSAIPNTVTIISQKQIAQSIEINDSLSGVLEQNVPGFGPSLNKLAGRGESLRGRNPLYLIDGVPQHNALRDGQRDGHTIDMDFLQKIEVIHGSNSIQGIGATGGVINMVTKSPVPGDGFSQDIKVSLSMPGNFDSEGMSKKITYSLGGRVGNLATIIGYSHNDRGLFFDGKGDPVGLYPTQGDIMDSTSNDIFFKSVYELDGQRLQLLVNDFSLKRNGDYVSVIGDRDIDRLTGTEKGDPRPSTGDPARTDATTVSLDYIHDEFYQWRIVAQLYYQEFEALYEGGTFGDFFRLTPDGEPFLDQSKIQSEKIGFKFLATKEDIFADGLNLTLGLDINEDETSQVLVQSNDRPWVPQARLEDVAPFVQLDFTAWDKLQLTTGLRFERAKLVVDDYTTIAAANSTFVSGGSPKFDETLLNVGAVYELTDDISIYSSFSEGFTMPDVGRVLRGIDTPGQSVDTFLDLSPVITENKEIGIKFNYNSFQLDAAVYQSDSDLGSRIRLDENGIYHVNREETRIRGLDISATWLVNDTVSVGANYANIEGEYDSDKDGDLDTDLDGGNIAPDRLNAFIEVDWPYNVNTKLSASHFFSRNFKGPGIAASKLGLIDFDETYTLVNLNASWQSSIGNWSFAVQNLLDKQYVTYFSQTEPGQRDNSYFSGLGRTVSFSYRKSF